MVSRVHGEIVIERPVAEVFDFVADERNEPAYNPAMVGVEKLTEGPIGAGTQFRATIASRGRPREMLLETTLYERPSRLASTTSMSGARICGTLTFEPAAGATRMSWDWDVAPQGALRLLSPIVGWVGRRQEATIWAGLKQHLESAPREG
jgi:Polyketide cyclase / dehydrase and lipid transport